MNNEVLVTAKEVQDHSKGDHFLRLLKRKGVPVVKEGKDLMLDPQYNWHTAFDEKSWMYVVRWEEMK